MDKIRTQLATHGLSEASLQLGNPYSGVRKSQEGLKDKEMAELCPSYRGSCQEHAETGILACGE